MQGRRISDRRLACTSRSSTRRLGQRQSVDTRGPRGGNCTGAIAPGIRDLTPQSVRMDAMCRDPCTDADERAGAWRTTASCTGAISARPRPRTRRQARMSWSGWSLRAGALETRTPAFTAAGGMSCGARQPAPPRGQDGERRLVEESRYSGQRWRAGAGFPFERPPLGPHPVRLTPRQTSRIGFFFPVSVNDRFTKRKYTILPAAFAF